MIHVIANLLQATVNVAIACHQALTLICVGAHGMTGIACTILRSESRGAQDASTMNPIDTMILKVGLLLLKGRYCFAVRDRKVSE